MLIVLSLAMGAVGLVVFLWTMRDGQYDDLDGAAERILLDQYADPERKVEPERMDGSKSAPNNQE
ncbi:cbb3-type cytochrome oxidase assembly protein CcoS [Arsenicitalea aurantiaca]|nr:cbb3-type cytochrome oxidase assembly protein CcoS [Arsenicitalea aurantiaca]